MIPKKITEEIAKQNKAPGRKPDIDFNSINPTMLSSILKTGSLVNLPYEYQEYYSIMEKVRDLRAKAVYNGKLITKGGIIRLLQNTHQLSMFEARRVYDDALNFFYVQDNVKPQAFANLYADQLDDAAAIALKTNQLETFERLKMSAAKLRGCFEKKAPEIPEGAYQKQVVIYSLSPKDIGVEPQDKKEVERFLDSLPDIPAIKMQRAKSDAGVDGYKFNILRNMAEDIDDFVEDEDKKD